MNFALIQYAAVVLQRFVEDRKLPEKGISYATTPKISAMNFTRSLTAPLSTSFTGIVNRSYAVEA